MSDATDMKTKIVFAMLVLMHVRLFASGEDFVAHEWGTFTSVQGADGIQMLWNPFVTSELPKFVYDIASPNGGGRLTSVPSPFSKGAMLTFQRMETPVIYFYSERERSVDVTVNFPEGTITEWFPQTAKHVANSIRWDHVQILPAKQNAALASGLPIDRSGSHYFAARETDSDFLQLKNDNQKVAENEKFLFYRGVANFKAPLQVTLENNEDVVRLNNTGTETLRHLYVLYVHKGQGKYIEIAELSAGREKTVQLALQKGQSPLSDLRSRISKDMAGSLVHEGLFDREASAMVKTWNDSWFSEDGLRVLYALPRAWTDRILPLSFSSQPSGVVRVMVGRAEMITPSMEWELTKEIVRYSGGDSAAREQAVTNARALNLGRFTEPAIRRLTSKMPNQEFSNAAWNLANAMGKPAEKKLALAN